MKSITDSIREIRGKSYEDLCYDLSYDSLNNTLYVLPPRKDSIENVVISMESFQNTIEGKLLISEYDIKIVTQGWIFDEFNSLREELRYTIIFPVFMPDKVKIHYFATWCEEKEVALQSFKLVSEGTSRLHKSQRNAIINLAYNDPDYFASLLLNDKKICDSHTEKEGNIFHSITSCAIDTISNIISPGMAMATTGRGIPEGCLSTEEYSISQMNILIKRFIQNVKKYKKNKDAKALQEIEAVLDNSVGIQGTIWKRVFTDTEINISTQKEIFNKFIDREGEAQKSRYKVLVKKILNNDDVKKNIGHYNVYLKDVDNGGTERIIKFTHQATAVVYIMYLIDRKKRGTNIECISLARNIEHFKGLYKSVYDIGSDDLDKKLNKLLYEEVKENGVKVIRTGRLKECYTDITNTLSEYLEGKENPAPFIVNARSHVMILSENIEIAPELMKFEFS